MHLLAISRPQLVDDETRLFETLPEVARHATTTSIRTTMAVFSLKYSAEVALDYMKTFTCVAVLPYHGQDHGGLLILVTRTRSVGLNGIVMARLPASNDAKVWLAKRPGDT